MIVEHSISIHAPRSVVWEVTTDVERWPDWTPTVTSIKRLDEGPLKTGSTVRIKQPGQPEAEWTVTRLVPGEHFGWESLRLGLKLSASHTIKWDGSNSTSILQVKAAGIFSKLLFPLLKISIGRALEQENEGLKKKCEELADMREKEC